MHYLKGTMSCGVMLLKPIELDLIHADEIMHIQALLKESDLELARKSKLLCDNISIQYITRNLAQHARTKYIKINIKYIKDIVLEKRLDIEYFMFELQLTDVLII